MQHVASTDGVVLAVHDLGGTGPTLLCSHATGLHGHCWEPFAHQLTDRYHVLALDYRAHGHSTPPVDGDFAWHGFGEDAAAVVQALGLRGCVAVGHSMGGAALLMAELGAPGTFSALALFEPIVFPSDPNRTGNPGMADGARRRRSEFPSKDAALENYAAKPPLNVLTADALAAYVEWGFEEGVEGVAVLRCTPEHEARTFEAAPDNGTYERLGYVQIPVLVLAGGTEDFGPGAYAEPAAAALPHGRFELLPTVGHFGPMEDPPLVAERVAAFFRQVGGS